MSARLGKYVFLLGRINISSRRTHSRTRNDSTLATVTGEIYKMELDGTIVGKFGKAGKQLGEFSGLHEIDCRNPDELFVSEIQLWRVQKLVLHPNGR